MFPPPDRRHPGLSARRSAIAAIPSPEVTMSRTRYILAVVAAGTFASACDSLSPTGIGGPYFKSESGDGAGQFMTLMTQNTLHGTQIGIVLSAPPSQIPLAVGRAYALVPS